MYVCVNERERERENDIGVSGFRTSAPVRWRWRRQDGNRIGVRGPFKRLYHIYTRIYIYVYNIRRRYPAVFEIVIVFYYIFILLLLPICVFLRRWSSDRSVWYIIHTRSDFQFTKKHRHSYRIICTYTCTRRVR